MSLKNHGENGTVTDSSESQLAVQLQDVQDQLDDIRTSRRPAPSFSMLTVLLVVVLIALFFYFIYDRTGHMSALKASLRQELSNEIQKTQGAVVPSEAAQRLNDRLDYLELRQSAIIDEARNSMQRQSFVFTTVAAFFGLFTVFFGYRQLLVETRGADSRDKHDQEMRNLVRSFQNNITTISSLIHTLERTLDYRRQIQDQLGEIQKRAGALESRRDEDETAIGILVDGLNRNALEVVPLGVDRAALSFEENRQRMETFVSRLTLAERTPNVDVRLNPVCYYVRGLNSVTTYQYEVAIADLDVAARKAREDIVQPRLQNYPPDRRENLQRFLGDLLSSCSYFQGVCHKNMGRYPESEIKFREALDRNADHWESRNYLLQVMFFDDNISFADVEAEYDKVGQRFEEALRSVSREERDKMKRLGASLRINQGDIYYPKPPLLQDLRVKYKQYENAEKAVQCYWTAYDCASTDLTQFCLAQGLEQVGSSLWRSSTPQELYSTAIKSLKRRVAGDFDKLYTVTLYYMLAICASKLAEHKGASEVFLSQARHGLKEVPTHVTCFSPMSRIRLTRPQILEEIEAFEKISL